jgi:hypothetical protein
MLWKNCSKWNIDISVQENWQILQSGLSSIVCIGFRAVMAVVRVSLYSRFFAEWLLCKFTDMHKAVNKGV